MLSNPYVPYDILSTLKDITTFHNLIIQKHKDIQTNRFQQITDLMSLTSVSFENEKHILTQEDTRPESLSDSPLSLAHSTIKVQKLPKTLKIGKDLSIKTQHMYGKHKSSMALAKMERNLQLKRNRLLRSFTKMKRWSPMEKFYFYRGLKAFGLDFGLIQKKNLPHRSEKELYEIFKKEDKRNSNRIDLCLEYHRAWKMTQSQGENDLELCSMHNSSFDNAFAGECTQCTVIRMNLNQTWNLNNGNIPSLDSVLEETKF